MYFLRDYNNKVFINRLRKILVFFLKSCFIDFSDKFFKKLIRFDF